eukprot:g6006.t1
MDRNVTQQYLHQNENNDGDDELTILRASTKKMKEEIKSLRSSLKFANTYSIHKELQLQILKANEEKMQQRQIIAQQQAKLDQLQQKWDKTENITTLLTAERNVLVEGMENLSRKLANQQQSMTSYEDNLLIATETTVGLWDFFCKQRVKNKEKITELEKQLDHEKETVSRLNVRVQSEYERGKKSMKRTVQELQLALKNVTKHAKAVVREEFKNEDELLKQLDAHEDKTKQRKERIALLDYVEDLEKKLNDEKRRNCLQAMCYNLRRNHDYCKLYVLSQWHWAQYYHNKFQEQYDRSAIREQMRSPPPPGHHQHLPLYSMGDEEADSDFPLVPHPPSPERHMQLVKKNWLRY